KSPDSTLIKVVLPAPLGPMTACNSPTPTSRETSSTAASPPKFLDNRRTCKIGSVIRDPCSWKLRRRVDISERGGLINRPPRAAGPARQVRSNSPSPTANAWRRRLATRGQREIPARGRRRKRRVPLHAAYPCRRESPSSARYRTGARQEFP